MSEKHEISQDVKIGRRFHDWKVFSKVSESSCRHGEVVLAAFEIDAIYAHIHKDDEPEPEPEPEPDCNKCIYTKLCDFAPRTSDGRENYMLIGQTGNLVTPDDTPAEEEKLICGNCYYIDNVDCGSGYCFRYPPTENELGVSETNRACGEHRLRE